MTRSANELISRWADELILWPLASVTQQELHMSKSTILHRTVISLCCRWTFNFHFHSCCHCDHYDVRNIRSVKPCPPSSAKCSRGQKMHKLLLKTGTNPCSASFQDQSERKNLGRHQIPEKLLLARRSMSWPIQLHICILKCICPNYKKLFSIFLN